MRIAICRERRCLLAIARAQRIVSRQVVHLGKQRLQIAIVFGCRILGNVDFVVPSVIDRVVVFRMNGLRRTRNWILPQLAGFDPDVTVILPNPGERFAGRRQRFESSETSAPIRPVSTRRACIPCE